jgi:hypothetical protein
VVAVTNEFVVIACYISDFALNEAPIQLEMPDSMHFTLRAKCIMILKVFVFIEIPPPNRARAQCPELNITSTSIRPCKARETCNSNNKVS